MAPDSPVKTLFTTERLVFRAVESTEDDTAFFHKHIMSDPVYQLCYNRVLPKPATLKNAEDYIKSIQETMLGVIICLAPSPADAKPIPIGILCVSSDNMRDMHQHRNAMMSIALAEPFRGMGYGGEAINWALDWAFRAANLHRIGIVAYSYNIDALKLYRKLGFVDEGCDRQVLYRNRAWYDAVRLSILEDEWEKLRGIEH
ncbi:hypothetical protein OIDMADRAFT_131227 [Oidiodendron maius Zn]|uniref:N-acetyltransferase domain-containing protein n=1 Tax=Oidiodendron maius (strain Zn) TaxID=913774 RepID=A0A0C3H065_OIDMZ|nr:hypothetical protein OIDMADRAFT_131227 [Oidiodendron maius Zn]